MGIFKKKQKLVYTRPSDYSCFEAAKNGNTITKLSLLVWGLGNLVNKQIARFVAFIALEIGFLAYMISFGIGSIGDFFTLGTVIQEEVWDDALGIYTYTKGDNSMLCLLYGVITFLILAFAVFAAFMSCKSAYCTQLRKEKGMKVPSFKDDLISVREENLHVALLTMPIIGIIIFSIIPLIFMILIAFTSYDHNHQPPGNLFEWVGLQNFVDLFAGSGALAKTFWPVLGWTLVWAVFATITTYVGGLLLALLINRNGTKAKGFWRFMFVLSVAVPQFVTLLSMRTIFNANGPINVILRNLGIIEPTAAVPFFTDPMIAKITIIMINIWIGVPYTMLSTTGILQNIPGELYEAAKIDGATAPIIFRKITLPYMIFVMTPNLITAFTGNINNFNVIYLLTGGGPETLDYYYAGKTDLLVTWLYRLTITQKDYNLGSVIGILTFIILAAVSLITFRNTASYKDEGAFQ